MAPKTKPAAGPNPEQLAALREYAALHGRTWKAQLNADWMRAGSKTFPTERWALLQQVRNAFGPAWLAKFRHPYRVAAPIVEPPAARVRTPKPTTGPDLKPLPEVRDVIATFPATFGLHGLPGKTFRISERSSYLDDNDRVVLYTQRLMPDNSWADFAKGSATQLRSQISEIRVAVLPAALVAAEQGIADAAARDRTALAESRLATQQRASVEALLAWAKARNDEGITELCRDALDAIDDGDRATLGALDCLKAAIEMVYQIELANRIATDGPLKGEAVGNEYVVTRRPIRMCGILAKFREREDAEKWIADQTRPLVAPSSPVTLALRTGYLCNACGVFCDATTTASEHSDWCPHGPRAVAGLPLLCPYCSEPTRSDSLTIDGGAAAHAKCVKAASS